MYFFFSYHKRPKESWNRDNFLPTTDKHDPLVGSVKALNEFFSLRAFHAIHCECPQINPVTLKYYLSVSSRIQGRGGHKMAISSSITDWQISHRIGTTDIWLCEIHLWTTGLVWHFAGKSDFPSDLAVSSWSSSASLAVSTILPQPAIWWGLVCLHKTRSPGMSTWGFVWSQRSPHSLEIRPHTTCPWEEEGVIGWKAAGL